MICLAQTEVNDSLSEAPEVAVPAGAPLITQLISIGYLSYDSALTTMPDYAIAQAKLKELRQAYEAELKRVEEEFNHKYEDFLDGQRDFPRTILLKRQTELQELLQQNIAFKQQGLKDLAKAESEALAPLREKLNAAIARVAKEKGLALVVNTDSNACPFIDPEMGVDLFPDVLRHLTNKK
jgi:outer membrane protein